MVLCELISQLSSREEIFFKIAAESLKCGEIVRNSQLKTTTESFLENPPEI